MYEILHRYTRSVLYRSETATNVREALTEALETELNADFSNADLSYADLSYADLSNANFSYANFSYANLSYADFSNADLSNADFSNADFSYAEKDLYAVFAFAPAEVPSLITALEQGKVNGSCYCDGQCGCLIGTLAMAAGAEKTNEGCNAVHGLEGNSDRPIERFFLAIKRGDTPENNPIVKIVHGWSVAWLERMKEAFGKDVK